MSPSTSECRDRADRRLVPGRRALRRGGTLRRLRVGRRRLGDGHVQGREPLRDASGGVHDVRERADRRGAAGPGAGQAAHRVPDHLRNRVGDDRHRDLQPASLNAKTGIISRRLDSRRRADRSRRSRATLPKNAVAATGFDCMSHALESLTARAWPRRLNPAQGVEPARSRRARIRFPTCSRPRR